MLTSDMRIETVVSLDSCAIPCTVVQFTVMGGNGTWLSFLNSVLEYLYNRDRSTVLTEHA